MRIIAGKFKTRPLKTPKSFETRPTQTVLREAVFNICQNEIQGADFLDLFAGSGGVGFEALSRGAASATFVESSKEAIRCIKENMQALGVQKVSTLLPMDVKRAIEILQKKKASFDIIYVDPPYDTLFDLQSLLPLMKSSSTLFLEGRLRKEPQQFPHFEQAARRNSGPSGPDQASYLPECGKILDAPYRSGESPSFEEGVLQCINFRRFGSSCLWLFRIEKN